MSEFRIAVAEICKTTLVIDGEDRILIFPQGAITPELVERANLLISLAEAG